MFILDDNIMLLIYMLIQNIKKNKNLKTLVFWKKNSLIWQFFCNILQRNIYDPLSLGTLHNLVADGMI